MSESAGQYVDRLLHGHPAPPVVAKQSDIIMERQYRVHCPQCGDHPDSPFDAQVDARNARRLHWQHHRDERI